MLTPTTFLQRWGADTALQFVEQAKVSFEALAETPGLGPPVASANSRLFGLRKWRIRGFDNLPIFYIPVDKGVLIVRVLHAAQDWWTLLDVN